MALTKIQHEHDRRKIKTNSSVQIVSQLFHILGCHPNVLSKHITHFFKSQNLVVVWTFRDAPVRCELCASRELLPHLHFTTTTQLILCESRPPSSWQNNCSFFLSFLFFFYCCGLLNPNEQHGDVCRSLNWEASARADEKQRRSKLSPALFLVATQIY